MRPMGIIELLTRIGEDNVRMQNLVESATNFQARKHGDTAVTFLTSEITTSEVASGSARHVGLVLWLPTERVKQAQADHARAAAPEEGATP